MYGDFGRYAYLIGGDQTTTDSFNLAFDYTAHGVNWFASHLGLLIKSRYGLPDLIRHFRMIDRRLEIDLADRLFIRRLSVLMILGIVLLVQKLF